MKKQSIYSKLIISLIWKKRKLTNISNAVSLAKAQAKNDFRLPLNCMRKIYDCKNFKIEKFSHTSSTSEKIILFLHGGAYQIPLTHKYRKIACSIAKKQQADVYCLDYRLAPEHKHPTQIEDAVNCYKFLLEETKTENITIIGDSSGGNLALLLVEEVIKMHLPIPKKIVLLSPWTDLSYSGDSYYENLYKDPIFGLKEDDDFIKHYNLFRKNTLETYLNFNSDPLNPKISPLFQDYSNFPPMLIIVGGNEMLLSDSTRLHEIAISNNISSTILIYEGLFHIFPILCKCRESRYAWKKIHKFLKD